MGEHRKRSSVFNGYAECPKCDFFNTKQMRNSLILYSEWYEILRELPDEDRLQALDAIMQYGFEDIEPSDKYIKAITALIFKGIDKTRTRYEEKCEKNRQNIAKRWKKKNTTAYNGIQSNTNVYDRIQSDTNDTNYNYNNNYSNNNNYELAEANNKEIKENRIKEKKESKAFLDEYFAKDIFIDGLCKELRSTPAELKTLAEGIIVEWDAAGETHSDYTDAHKHLTSTLRIKSRESKRVNNNTDNRPPKPSVHHVWSDALQEWVYAF